jgi:NDP-sugar pyrophosphorylase family protein
MADSLAGPATDEVVGVVLAAGAGTRLRPLTWERPKALCPVGDVPLLDLGLARMGPLVAEAAVNVHHGRAAMEEHLAGRPDVHVSVEEPVALGTAGALGRLRPWIAGRAVAVVNADAWCPDPLDALFAGWDGERVRLLLVGADTLHPQVSVAGCLLPWAAVAGLEAEPSGLYEVCWRPWADRGAVEVVRHDGAFVDCGTPADYLAANLEASGGASVIGAGAAVEGRVVRAVLWPGARVEAGEVLRDAIRTPGGLTVLVR